MDSRCVIFEPGQADQFIYTPLAEGETQYQEEQEEENKSKDQMSLACVSTVPFPTLPDVCLPILQQCLPALSAIRISLQSGSATGVVILFGNVESVAQHL